MARTGRWLVRGTARRALLAACIVLGLAPPAGAAVCDQCPGCLTFYYVRACGRSNASECSDTNDGKRPQTAWATLRHAAQYVNDTGNPGDVVIVGPGVYPEGDVDLRRPGVLMPFRPIQFRADSTGSCTADPPGDVVVDAGKAHDTGFLVFGASNVVVAGFRITGGRIAGVQVRPGPEGEQSSGAIVANNIIYGNGETLPGGDRIGRGVDITDSTGPVVFNNLIYSNLSTGVGVLGTPKARVINNTMYGNGADGVVIARNPISLRTSPGAWVVDNIIANVGTNAVAIAVDANSRCDYIGAFNLLDVSTIARYAVGTPRDPSDVVGRAAGFIAPDGGDFALMADSPARNGGSVEASVLGLDQSSTTGDGVPDAATVDLGYHENQNGFPVLHDVPLVTQMLYVRGGIGDDTQDGLSVRQPLATLNAALAKARAKTRIVVGPGTYQENLRLEAEKPAGPLELVGDATGLSTGDVPGAVLVDAGGDGDGISIVGRCSTIIDGFSLTNAADRNGASGNGVAIKEAHNSIIRNNIAFSNSGLGIDVADSDDVSIINNLAYANGDKALLRGGGIQVGGDIGSNKAIVQNNTCYANGVNGIQIGTGQSPSTGATVFYNIMQGNGQNGIQLGSDTTADLDLPDYMAGYNLNFEGAYGAGTPRPFSDIVRLDPLFIDPDGRDGVLGKGGFRDDDFHLSHGAAGQARTSPAVDSGDITAEKAGVDALTTRTDGMPDVDAVDLGYHYPHPRPLIGDCNLNGTVTIDEVVLAVNIALGDQPMSMCPSVDVNGDGLAMVNELLAAVISVLQGS